MRGGRNVRAHGRHDHARRPDPSTRRGRLKHLFVTQDYAPDRGGMARRHVELCRRLAGEGDVMIVHTVASTGSATFDVGERYEIIRERFPFSRANRFTNQLRWARHLVKLIRARAIDIIHCGNVRPAGYAAWWAHRRTGVPYLLYVNGGDLLRERRKATRRMKRLGARKIFGDAEAIIANSSWTAQLAREVMREVGVTRMPDVVTIELGTDPDHFSPTRDRGDLRKRLGVGNGPLLLTVARLVPHKGQDVAMRALALLADEFPDLRYVMVGEGHDETRLRALAWELGVTFRVVFAGTLTDDEIAEAYATADVYVGISRLDAGVDVEGFGISFVEAGASGTPSVAGDSGGVRSAVRHGQTGIVVSPDDPREVADAVRQLLRDERTRSRMGQAAREAVESHYNWDRVARATREVARKVLAAPYTIASRG